MNSIKNIVFDFGGILFDIDVKAAIHSMSKLLGIPYENGKIPDELLKILQDYEIGAFNTEKFVWNLQYISTTKPQAIDIIKAWNSMLIEMKEEKFEKLLALRKSYKVYLLSNINDLHLNYIYRYFRSTYGITDWDDKYFEKTYYSHIIGKRKPDVSTFEYVWNDARLVAEESLFIDDMIENVNSAKSLNIHTIHHDPSEDVFEVLHHYFN